MAGAFILGRRENGRRERGFGTAPKNPLEPKRTHRAGWKHNPLIFRNLNIFASVLGFRRWSRRRDALAWAPQSIYRSTPAIHSQGIRVRDGRLARPDVPRRAHVSDGVGISQLVASCHYGLTVRLEIHDVGPQSRTIAIHHHQQISIAVSA